LIKQTKFPFSLEIGDDMGSFLGHIDNHSGDIQAELGIGFKDIDLLSIGQDDEGVFFIIGVSNGGPNDREHGIAEKFQISISNEELYAIVLGDHNDGFKKTIKKEEIVPVD
jgi:hypothetical protein